MKKILPWGLGLLLIAAAAGFYFLRPVPYRVDRSMEIVSPPEKVFAAVANLNEWPKWSPWLIVEPGAEVTVTGQGPAVGDVYTWSGNLIGEGEMEIVATEPPTRVEMEIRFRKPFKSQGLVSFTLKPLENATQAQWSMEGKMPKVLAGMISGVVGLDYERGLGMLKEYCEHGGFQSETEVTASVDRPAVTYVGVQRTCSLDEIGTVMSDSFFSLIEGFEKAELESTAPPFCIYRVFDLQQRRVDFITAFPVENVPGSLPEGLIAAEIPAHRALRAIHTGPYRHLGNAWSTGEHHLRAGKEKADRSIPPYEVYLSDPSTTPESEVVTEVYFPLK